VLRPHGNGCRHPPGHRRGGPRARDPDQQL